MQQCKTMPAPTVYPPFTRHSGKTSVTKCACGMPEDDAVEMVMCTNRKCYTWQHSQCVGFQGDDDLSNYECPLCSRGEKWSEEDDKRLMEEFELEVGKKEPRDKNDFFKEFLERYEIDETTGFLDRRFSEISEDFLLDESVDINRRAAVCIRGKLRIPQELRESLESCDKLESDGNGGYKYTSKDKKVKIVSAPRRQVTVKPEESEEDPAAASPLAPNAPFSLAEDPATLPNDASAPQSPGLHDIPEYDPPQQDFDLLQNLSQNLAETSDVASQDTRTPSPGVHERLLVKIRPSDFPSLFPAHLLAAPVPATPTPTPSKDRKPESPTPPVLAHDTRTPAPLPLKAAPPSTSTKSPATSTIAPPVDLAPVPPSSTSHVPNDAPMDLGNLPPPPASAPNGNPLGPLGVSGPSILPGSSGLPVPLCPSQYANQFQNQQPVQVHQPGANHGACPSYQPGLLELLGLSSRPGLSRPLYPTHFQGCHMPINSVPQLPANYGAGSRLFNFSNQIPMNSGQYSGLPGQPVSIPIGRYHQAISNPRSSAAPFNIPASSHPSWCINPCVPDASRKRKHEELNTNLAMPEIPAYNILFVVKAFLDGLEQSALKSLAKEFERAMVTREKELKEKMVPYNIFFDHLELVYKLLKDKSREKKAADGEIDAKLFWQAFWKLPDGNRMFLKEFVTLCGKIKMLWRGRKEKAIKVSDIEYNLRAPFLVYLSL
ncbi:hypothetical protein GCK72_004069 [Caenorhabditis remanei]|uniref:Zinc finger PHD-type domain-containing protein n=1 Tax=Caenorhabditis remanei TaxID=31234 RepID=A0A6A5HCL3_CAERE|nr:hypothetical protein GCK72_004069 [Caenorhabditis remanei]KAF1764122.1 hypothetical protein GCK72_004069 [Caenorhabditis remanei]